ncbi:MULTISPECIES: glycosyltransferase family 39 protein [unclassified Streptomyces]|uniref:glycosyltransferase family 39 protein n=1 Tax=unclassified Streptomyces TaxID=2593676 RepID=UPI0028C41714|nr:MULTISPECIES: glycosyltransferase family 39 protein [unclassified Streptomyces]WNO73333.1 glycosyltransferase family 39 protein [Streptomyces sp. AM8-1-1]
MRARRCTLSAETFDRAAAAGARPVPRWRAALLRAAPALGLFAAARLTGLLVMAGWAWHIERSPRAIIARAWDSDWYMLIAEHGYGRTLYWPDGAVQSDLAFFPLYPALIRAVTTVLPVTSGTAGLLISWAAAGAAAWGIYAVVERLHGRRTATVTVVLWGLLPHSIVLSMAYTEPVLTAFAAWSLYAVLTRRWLWAGTLATLAGLSRPNGIAVAAAVVAVAAYELVRAARGSERAGWRLWAGAAVAPLGWCGYVLSVGYRKGDVLGGYFAVQSGWTSKFDFGVGALRVVRDIVLKPTLFSLMVALLVVAAAVLLFALLVLDRPPAAIVVYTAVLLLITLGGSGFFESKPRFLLPAFPLLLPLARALTKARPGTAVVMTVALAGLSFAYGTYLLTLSPIAL